MNTFVTNLPRSLCLLVLLATAGCDQALARLAGPDGLRGATPTMQDEKDDGGEAGDDGSGDELGLPKIICCNCERNCTQPDEPDPMVGG